MPELRQLKQEHAYLEKLKLQRFKVFFPMNVDWRIEGKIRPGWDAGRRLWGRSYCPEGTHRRTAPNYPAFVNQAWRVIAQKKPTRSYPGQKYRNWEGEAKSKEQWTTGRGRRVEEGEQIKRSSHFLNGRWDLTQDCSVKIAVSVWQKEDSYRMGIKNKNCLRWKE